MVGKTSKECLAILSNFLDKKTLNRLAEKHKITPNLSEFVKALLEILCDSFPANFGTKYEDLYGEEVPLISSLAAEVPSLFSSATLFGVFRSYFQELVEVGNNAQSGRLCKIIAEFVRSCPLPWLFQVNEAERENREISHFEKSKEYTVNLVLFLLKNVDLMPLSTKELHSHSKQELFPRLLHLCHSILRKVCDNSDGIPDNIRGSLKLSILRKVARDIVIACIQQTGKSFWISEVSRKVASELLEFVTNGCGCNDAGDLLSGSDTEMSSDATNFQQRKIFPNGLLGNILQSMKHFMTEDKLVDSPVAIHVLVWSIRKVKHPFLGRYVSMVIPPLLCLVDDYRVDNRVIGIQCLEHVVININATELCWYGRAEVIYEALHHCIYTNEPQVMYVLQSCLLKILKVVEPSPKKPTLGRKMNKCDQNFQIILSSMEFESKIALRRAYCSHLVKFIDHMGITVLRHFKRLLRVVFGYLEISDGPREEWRLDMLDVLKSIITNAWPRIPAYADGILKSLMKLVIDILTSFSVLLDIKQQMFTKIEDCLMLLLFCCGEPVKRQLEEMTMGIGHSEAEDLISRTLDSYRSQTE